MTVNRFGHIDLRVSNLGSALAFYKQLLPALGFTLESQGESWIVFAPEGEFPERPFFGLTEDLQHQPNKNRIAFWAGSPDEVDRLAELIRDAGGQNIGGPRDCPEYSSTYHAVFFDDPSGNALEVYFRTN